MARKIGERQWPEVVQQQHVKQKSLQGQPPTRIRLEKNYRSAQGCSMRRFKNIVFKRPPARFKPISANSWPKPAIYYLVVAGKADNG